MSTDCNFSVIQSFKLVDEHYEDVRLVDKSQPINRASTIQFAIIIGSFQDIHSKVAN